VNIILHVISFSICLQLLLKIQLGHKNARRSRQLWLAKIIYYAIDYFKNLKIKN